MLADRIARKRYHSADNGNPNSRIPYFVYAGARKDSDLQALGAMKNVQALRLDVTKPDDIDAARKIIERGGRGLYGLVNNAVS